MLFIRPGRPDYAHANSARRQPATLRDMSNGRANRPERAKRSDDRTGEWWRRPGRINRIRPLLNGYGAIRHWRGCRAI